MELVWGHFSSPEKTKKLMHIYKVLSLEMQCNGEESFANNVDELFP